MKITTCDLSDIKLNSNFLRIDTDIETLKKSIDKIGLINPVTINKDSELLAGARRYQAAKELGWTEIPVHIIDRDRLEQELISIDENLIRAQLSKLELESHLNRGRAIYEELNPNVNKVDIASDHSAAEENTKQKEAIDNDSFTAVTAEKTGLSKSVIKNAIKRDELASESVKKARSQGELNASQTDEIIALDKENQEIILPLIANKTVKEARKIVQTAKNEGIEAAKIACNNLISPPKEYTQLKSPLKRANKILAQILLEELKYEGPEQQQINQEMLELKEKLDNYFQMFSK